MFIAVFVFFFLIATVMLSLAIYGVCSIIKWQANKKTKRFFAPIPRPGSFSFVALEGRIVETIENVVGWKLMQFGEDRLFVLGKKEELGFWERTLGVVWIGIFETIKIFKDWSWMEYKQAKTKGEKTEKELEGEAYKIVSRQEDVSEFLFQFPYTVITDEAEIKDNIKVKITAVLTVWHLHPIRAFFLNKDPIALFNAMIQSEMRTYIKDMEFDSVKGIRASSEEADTPQNGKTFWDVIKKLNGINFDEKGNPDYNNVDPLGLFGKLGYAVVRGEIVQVEGVGEAADAIEAKRLAELRGDAVIAEAKKGAEATIIKADADAKAMDKRREARERWVDGTIVIPTGGVGPHVAQVLVAEQVASPDSHITTWVQDGKAIVTIPAEKQK